MDYGSEKSYLSFGRLGLSWGLGLVNLLLAINNVMAWQSMCPAECPLLISNLVLILRAAGIFVILVRKCF